MLLNTSRAPTGMQVIPMARWPFHFSEQPDCTRGNIPLNGESSSLRATVGKPPTLLMSMKWKNGNAKKPSKGDPLTWPPLISLWPPTHLGENLDNLWFFCHFYMNAFFLSKVEEHLILTVNINQNHHFHTIAIKQHGRGVIVYHKEWQMHGWPPLATPLTEVLCHHGHPAEKCLAAPLRWWQQTHLDLATWQMRKICTSWCKKREVAKKCCGRK